MPRRFGDQHRENMKRVKAETKALKKGKISGDRGKKPCTQCNGGFRLMPRSLRTTSVTSSGRCPNNCDNGWL